MTDIEKKNTVNKEENALSKTEVRILGTSHIAKQSLVQIRNEIKNNTPDIVAVELDKKRLAALLSERQSRFSFYNMWKVGIKGYLFALLGSWGSKKLGKLVGAVPGQEMLEAINLAKKNKLDIALIDQDIEITLRNFSKALTWKEKWRFVKEIFRAVFRRKEVEKELGIDAKSFDLTKVPSAELIKKLTGLMKEKYPNIYHVLVYERNVYMAKNIIHLIKYNKDKKILVIVGAGHVEGIVELLNKRST